MNDYSLKTKPRLTPIRDKSNYRVYSNDQIDEAKWIKKLQSLGMQLKEIESLKSEVPDVHVEVLKNVLEREQEVACRFARGSQSVIRILMP